MTVLRLRIRKSCGKRGSRWLCTWMPTQTAQTYTLYGLMLQFFQEKPLWRFVPFFSFPVRFSSFVLARSMAALRRIRQERAEQNEVANKKLAKEKNGERARGLFYWVNFLERNFGYLVLKYFPAEFQ